MKANHRYRCYPSPNVSRSYYLHTIIPQYRYVQYGSISAKAACLMGKPEVLDYFAKLIQRVAPKSYAQAIGEVKVCQKFLENFGGDQVLIIHSLPLHMI